MKLLLTTDVSEFLNKRHSIPLSDLGIKTEIDDIEAEYIEYAVPYIFEVDDSLVVKNEDIIELYNQRKNHEHLPIVSIDDLWSDEDIYYFQINRQLDLTTNTISLSARDGHENLGNQTKRLKEALPHDEIILVDRGCVGGGTILYTISLLQKHYISVREIWLGAHTEKGMDTLKKEIDSSVKIYILSDEFRCSEWIELRDLLGISGRPVKNGNLKPYYVFPEYISMKIPNVEKLKYISVYFSRKILSKISSKAEMHDALLTQNKVKYFALTR